MSHTLNGSSAIRHFEGSNISGYSSAQGILCECIILVYHTFLNSISLPSLLSFLFLSSSLPPLFPSSPPSPSLNPFSFFPHPPSLAGSTFPADVSKLHSEGRAQMKLQNVEVLLVSGLHSMYLEGFAVSMENSNHNFFNTTRHQIFLTF